VSAEPVMSHSGKYFCSAAFAVRNTGKIGSQPQTTVVMPSALSLAMTLAAWFDSVARSSL
jgi:hypothetical protein